MGRSQILNLARNPTMQNIKIIDKDLAVVTMKKTIVQLDRPIFVGVVVLELAKEVMYRFHYEFAVPT